MQSVDSVNFKEFISGETVLLEFFAPWCQPCKTMNNILDNVEKYYDVSVGKIDVESFPSVAGVYDVVGIPTTILFKHGVEVDRLVGAKPVQVLVDKFNLNEKTHIDTVSM